MDKIVKRKPWNRVSEQVYSVSTNDVNAQVNMNIATYITPINMQPKRYSLAIYKNTKTHDNIFSLRQTNKYLILQALSKNQAKLVNILGKKSGLKYDKAKYLQKQNLLKDFSFQSVNYHYLNDNVFTLFLEIEELIEAGDHDLAICKNIEIIENNFDKEFLNTKDLEEARIIL